MPALAAIAQWWALIQQAATQYHIEPEVIATVIQLESGGDPNALGDPVKINGKMVRAVGLMQVEPKDAFDDRPTTEELLEPEVNIPTGTSILSGCLKDTDLAHALCCYFGAPSPESEDGCIYLGAFRKAWDVCWPNKLDPIDAPVPPTLTPSELVIRNLAWNNLYPVKVPYVPDHAFPVAAKARGLAQPLTLELTFNIDGTPNGTGDWICQGYDGSPGQILWCRVGDWANIQAVAWE